MIPIEANEKFSEAWKQLNIIWAGFMISVCIFLLVSLATEDQINIPVERSDSDIMRIIFFALSVVFIFLSRFFVKYSLSGKGLKDLGKFIAGRKNQLPEHPAIARYRAAMVIALGMCQVIAVMAMVLFFAGNNRLDLYLLLMMSAAGILYHRPKKDEILSMAQELKK